MKVKIFVWRYGWVYGIMKNNVVVFKNFRASARPIEYESVYYERVMKACEKIGSTIDVKELTQEELKNVF